jgi:hypothetical protein
MGRLLVLASALALAMCNPIPSPVPPSPIDASDASPGPTPVPDPIPTPPAVLDAAPGPSDACRRSYDHLVGIGCKPKPPTSGTWVDVCRSDRQHGAFRLDGIERAATPADARRAGVSCIP